MSLIKSEFFFNHPPVTPLHRMDSLSPQGIDPLLTALIFGLVPAVYLYTQVLRASEDGSDHGSSSASTVRLMRSSKNANATAIETGGDALVTENKKILQFAPRKKGMFGVTAKQLKSHAVPSVRTGRNYDCFVEASLSDFTSCINASLGGVNSIELCCNRTEGGVTPSFGLVSAAVRYFKHSDVSIHVLIRPRGGDFCYSDGEFECIAEDVAMCRDIGVDGIVVGFLTAQGHIDYEKLQIVMDIVNDSGDSAAARPPLQVTFHRAFDICRDIGEHGGESLAPDGHADVDNEVSTNNITFVDGDKHTSHVVVRKSATNGSANRASSTSCSVTVDAKPVTGAADAKPSATGVSDTWVDCEAESSSYREMKKAKGGNGKDKGTHGGDSKTAPLVPGPLVLASPTVISAPCSPLSVPEDGPSTEYMATPLVRSAVTTVQRLLQVGVTRILTSGRCGQVEQSIRDASGVATMDNLIGALRHSEVGDKVQFVVASGIRVDNVAAVLQYTHAHCVHAGSTLHSPITSVLADNNNSSSRSHSNTGGAMSYKNALICDSHFASPVPTQVPYADFQTTTMVDIDLTRELVNSCVACWNVSEPMMQRDK